MKLKCKLCNHVVDVANDPIKGAVMMASHVQTRHAKLAYGAVQAIAAYLSTYFFEPVVDGPAVLKPDDVDVVLGVTEQYKETKKNLLQGFREWARVAIK